MARQRCLVAAGRPRDVPGAWRRRTSDQQGLPPSFTDAASAPPRGARALGLASAGLACLLMAAAATITLLGHGHGASVRLALAPPVQTPAVHTSFWVQALPSLHAVPSVTALNVVVDTDGWQLWHAFAGFGVPEA